MRESKENITRVSSDEARLLKGETDYARLDAMTDADIAKAVADDPDAAPIDIDWTKARLTLPPGKDVVTLRLDHDVLEWFRAQGKGYQTRINRVLRAFYEARRNQSAADVVEDPLFELARLVEGYRSEPANAPSSASAPRLDVEPAQQLEGEFGAKEQRQASFEEKAYAAKKRRAAKPAAKATVAKRRA